MARNFFFTPETNLDDVIEPFQGQRLPPPPPHCPRCHSRETLVWEPNEPLVYVCDNCGNYFSREDVRDAHKQRQRRR